MSITVVTGAWPLSIDVMMTTIPTGTVHTIPVNYQQIIFGSLIINGSIEVLGILNVSAMPA
ncbi:MAG: hypothetical protein Q8M94_03905 [Ignavibacteria bacterium]|nr:hypothetical protein [Ignavibacteria bacterium]